MGGTTHGDQQGLAGLDKATHDVLVSSPGTAAELALRALELTDPMDAGYVIRAEMAVVALLAGWRLGEATESARSTLARPGLMPVPAARRRATSSSSILFMSGESGEALAEATRVIDVPSCLTNCMRLPSGSAARPDGPGRLEPSPGTSRGDPRRSAVTRRGSGAGWCRHGPWAHRLG